uniref:Aluminum-activated malate transporter n=1 Tax=Fagus sylvatica TaxID=28930 RepID=A0A2N9FNQ1_FAGSY
MNIASPSLEDIAGPAVTRAWGWLKSLPEKLWAKVDEVAKDIKKLGRDDPRRIHPFAKRATLGKGLNRMLATLSAGALAVGVHHLATLSGEKGEPWVLGFFVFITVQSIQTGYMVDAAATVTFFRFFPTMKARYDYGLLIFILTFALVTVSSYREDKVIQMGHQRVTTIILGSFIAIVICICIYPVWIGEELQNLVANNMEKLGNFLEGYGGEYFKISEHGQHVDDKSFLQGYKSALTSKNSEETMANLARWELWHHRFGFLHPWKQYVQVGTLTRQCAYKIEALNSYLNSEIQTPNEFGRKIQEPCTQICSESGKALRELASAVKKLTQPTSVNVHIEKSKMATENLKSMLNSRLLEDANLQEVMQSAAVALILIDVVPCIMKIADAVHNLASLANFKAPAARVSP